MSDSEPKTETRPRNTALFVLCNLPLATLIFLVIHACYAWAPRGWVHSWNQSHANAAFLCLFILPLIDVVNYQRRNGGKAAGWWLALAAALGVPAMYAARLFSADHPAAVPSLLIASVIAGAVYLAVCARLANTRAPFSAVIVAALLTAFCTAAVFNYYKFSKRAFGMVENMDVCYYYTNAKFFPELGYYELYPAMLLADSEGRNRFKGITRFRNLHDYNIIKRGAYLTPQQSAAIKEAFTPERWEEFKKDVAYWQVHPPSNGWSYFFTDHGFNPPPTWTVVGGMLANWVDIEHIKYLCMLDLALMCLLFAAIAWAFGAETMLFALFWYATTFSGRWPMVATAYLRHDWVVALALSVCLLAPGKRLERTRGFLAGGCMAYAASVRVFPAVFFWPYGILFLRDTWRWWRNRSAAPYPHAPPLLHCRRGHRLHGNRRHGAAALRPGGH